MARVFVIDDDPEVVTLLACILEQEGYEVIAFTSAEEGLSAVRADPPALLLLDLLMPEIDGGEFCRRLKGDPRTEHVRVIILSGHGYLEREAREAGADGYLGKPFDVEDVLTCAAKLLDGAERASGAH